MLLSCVNSVFSVADKRVQAGTDNRDGHVAGSCASIPADSGTHSTAGTVTWANHSCRCDGTCTYAKLFMYLLLQSYQ